MLILSAHIKNIPATVILLLIFLQIQAQPITGIWKGKMGSSRVELKLIRKGDSLIGTSYYYDSKTNYRRYSVKGYFDDKNNDVIWWDDVLLEDQGTHHFIGTGSQPDALLAVADFNCPGEGIMKLDGKSSRKDDDTKGKKELHLVKGNSAPVFPDEWDFLIENYAYGVIHPEIVDSIEQLSYNAAPPQSEPAKRPQTLATANPQTASEPVNRPQPATAANPQTETIDRPMSNNSDDEKPSTDGHMASPKQTNTVVAKPPTAKQEVVAPVFIPPSAQSNEERFTNRTKILQNVIPVKGDSIELRFYDNAEIDGDSIAVFLNGRLLKEHILLAEEAYIMKIAVNDLQPDNELVMVAENLGSIPPNTSLMVAIVGDKRYEAHLQSTEGSSALVRLVKP
jgi:hypothetical protein